MTAYNPQPTVTVGGVDYTSETINRVTINAGRVTIDDQPRAGYANISLIVTDNTYPEIDLNSVVRVSVVDSSGAEPFIFTGYVTDVARRIANAGPLGLAVTIDITAAGPLARLAKQETAASYSKEYDGTRISNILIDVFATAWNEVLPATLAWNAVDPAKTWLTYDPGFAGTIDTPGDYQLTSYSGGAVEALSLTRLVANSALGVLYETGDGLINYDASGTRVNRVSTSGFTEIPADDISSTNLQTTTQIADLINDLTITYKSGATVTAQDTASVATYGLFSASRSTYLETVGAANQQLSFFLDTRATPRTNLGTISVPLHNPNLADVVRDDLIGVFCGLPVSVPDFPTALLPTPFSGFVEGYTWTLTRHTLDLAMTVSDYGLSAIQQAWDQVLSTEVWNTLLPTLKWENAEVVA